MKEFGAWFNDQGKSETEEVDDTIYLTCRGCGKTEFVSSGQLENGDTRWYCEYPDSGLGLCGGQFCLP